MENLKHNIIPVLLIILAGYTLTIGIGDVWGWCLFLTYITYSPTVKNDNYDVELTIGE